MMLLIVIISLAGLFATRCAPARWCDFLKASEWRRPDRRWQQDRDDELDAPDQYPDPEPEHPYTPNQS